MVSILASRPSLIPSIQDFFSVRKIVDVAEVNQRCCLDESGQWLEDVDQTHLVLASGKLVLQKCCPVNLNP